MIARERILREMAGIVGEVVDEMRRHCRLTKEAEARAADFIGSPITPRQIKAWRWGEKWAVSAEEADALRDARRRLAAFRVATLRAELAAEERALQELGCAIHTFDPAGFGKKP